MGLLEQQAKDVRDMARWLTTWSRSPDWPGNEALIAIKACASVGGIVYVAGNGGSAEQAEHLSAELLGIGIPCIALTASSSVLTALSNDMSYEEALECQLMTMLNENDLFIGISTSGESDNIIRCFKEARQQKVVSFLLGGNHIGSRAGKAASYMIEAPFENTQRIQELHLMIIHYWYESLRAWRKL
jgi:D-sedoheptulose 7-phosphate isomerase